MQLPDFLYYLAVKLRLRKPVAGAKDYALPPSARDEWAARAHAPLAKLFFAHRGRTVHKWAHYLERYDTYFAPFIGTRVRILEIGVRDGGSLDLWRAYFGKEAVIHGIDVDPACKDRVSPPNRVHIGSQDDSAFLEAVVAEMQGIDIVIDDGSHIGRHQRASFAVLFPALAEGGLYIIEDIHTSYWPGEYEGGYRRRGTAIELVKQLVDDMHASFHDRGGHAVGDFISAIHVFNWTVVIEKRSVAAMGHLKSGGTGADAAGH